MWIGDKIYFDSDRDGTFNLYAYDVATGARPRSSRSSKTWDVRWPSADPQTGGSSTSWTASCTSSTRRRGKSDADSHHRAGRRRGARPSRVSAADKIEDVRSLSPKGERALFVARGDIFTAPIEKGPTRNLTHSSGAHDKWPAWSPDGAKIAFISDMSGEEEIWVVAQDGIDASRSSSRRAARRMRLRARVVARRQAHRVQRQGRPACSS